jgi:hypothetical protein
MPKSSKTMYLAILIIVVIAVSMTFVLTSSAPTGQWRAGINCNDSDGGLNYSVKGTCSDRYYPNGISDTCWAGTGGNLKELFCNTRNQCEAKRYTCPNGCLNGICNSVPQPPTQEGSIYAVSSPSNATARLNGVTKGITPLTISNLTAGTYTLNLSRSGYYDNVTSVIVYAGQTTNVYAYLSPISTGSIYATSNPSNASVQLNGTNKGLTPLVISNVTAGNHYLLFSKPGYYDNVTSVNVRAGQSTSVSLSLSPINSQTGALYITSNPLNASVQLNGTNRGFTPLVIANVTAGRYSINMTKSGYYDNATFVNVTSGQITNVYVILRQR